LTANRKGLHPLTRLPQKKRAHADRRCKERSLTIVRSGDVESMLPQSIESIG